MLSTAQKCLNYPWRFSIRHFYHHNYQATQYSRSPSLRLNGNWLADAGFSTDRAVTVSVEPGRLVIEPVKG
ncbi:type I toxin-antitoxin system SymE family toxin [Leclercia pneumoniae]|uniref:Type I toxin-antitoxin system SymE family toxin n=1 Tax=Leclercia pneumoniae TaxID=2815358 RepID=A0ABX8JZW2_9ENTR|nr:type I toxin-antitoxin system SymE family toxin [Leclercia pneumoniae]QWW81795.1 type I toxin-antitoxin system SymE family toxin [Leclercia pneumoniae]